LAFFVLSIPGNASRLDVWANVRDVVLWFITWSFKEMSKPKRCQIVEIR
jgi:hypothetical protein